MWALKSEIIISAWKNLMTDSIVILPSVYNFFIFLKIFRIFPYNILIKNI